ncbi:beta-N-acetylhexosaminidase [Microbacterium sp. KUDC0406]|uniref:glycoside hydrolase family 20 zincin-like fold domain-containing protein n=1 Tax=Microbacterium sp. KUDC0406 TaxID=2909588 RepID=UPI001F46EF64|nr:glycoside hydrolase family 20 zincin-like fold domain-containing protein [Microbacterium sp. KUDC0406]UJP08788.1 beta-N-acetylhexosaminidase [Microbacterium sp. KUDC0406]
MALAAGTVAGAPADASAAALRSATDTVANAKPTVIPALKTWSGGEGDWELSDSTRIIAPPALDDMARQFAADLDAVSGIAPAVMTDGARAGDIVLTQDGSLSSADGGQRFSEEGYTLAVDDRVQVSAPSATGVFYGTRTILQILAGTDSRTSLPRGKSADWPDYAVRGFMLDVGRRFFTPGSFAITSG